MTPTLQYRFGYTYTLWTCSCGHTDEIRTNLATNTCVNTSNKLSISDSSAESTR